MERLPCAAWAILVIFSMALPARGQPPTGGALRAVDLRCEHWVEPLGIDVARPHLEWRLALAPGHENDRGVRQSAWEVRAGSTAEGLGAGEADLWEFGGVAGGQTRPLEYQGRPLASTERAFWQVRVWDQDGRPSEWSPVASWTMGLLAPADWKARWIGMEDREPPLRCRGIGYHAAETRKLDETKWVQ